MKNFLIISLIFLCLFQSKTFAQNDISTVDILMQKGQFSQALILLEKLNIGDSTQLEILQKQAICNLKLGRFSRAKKLYYSVLQRNPESSEILLQIATIGEKENNYLEAFKSYQKLNLFDSTNTFYWKELARISSRMERSKDAISYLKKAISLDDKDIESIASLANLYLNIPEDDLAEPLIAKGFKLDSSSIKIRYLRSRFSYRNSDFKDVRKNILYIMSLGDSTAYYQRLLGTAYYYLDSIPQSIAIFRRLISVGEDTENVRAGLAFALLKSTENNQDILLEANRNFNEAINLGTSDRISDYEIGMADVYDKNGDYQIAINHLQKVINSRPKAVFRLAEIYEKKKNDKEMALVYYQEYIRACGKVKKPTADCNFIDLAIKRINNLNPKLKLELPKIVAQRDSNEVVVDTVRNDLYCSSKCYFENRC
ncbi:MAG: Tfp pilus assembly protein PilF [Bacteroidota bacterium]